MLLLLAGLAILQYRWIGEVSQAEESRMRAGARRAADGVATDFNREIFRVLEHFSLPPRSAKPDGGLGSLIAENAKRWSAESRFPSLIAGIFVSRPGGKRDDDLDRVNLSSGLLEPAPWPSDLEAARQWITTRPRTSLRAPLRFRFEGKGPELDRKGPEMPMRHWFGPQILDEVPAVLIPDLRHSAEPGRFIEEPTAERWIILWLDRRAILTDFLPHLVRRYFGETGEYDVAVLRRDDPSAVLYRSREGFPAGHLRTSDAEVFLLDGPLSTLAHGGGAPSAETSPRESLVFFGTAQEAQRVAGLGQGAWRLVAVHRAGSLQAAVRATRRRNLAVSGAILVLLGVTVAALVTSSQRAQRLARQQVEFVASLTHELRTPLAAIRSAGQNLADGLVQERDRVRKYGRLLERESRRLSGLIEDALAQADIEARREAVRTGSVAIPPILDEVTAALRPLAQEYDTAVDSVISDHLPPVAGDPSALRTLFENLVSNAIKYGGRQGQVRLQALPAGSTIEVTVQDRGPGISPQDLPHIFEPFYRGSDVSSRRVSGSGLGLSLVRRVAEAHGGRVVVQSELGKGTAFCVTLPGLVQPADDLHPQTGAAS